MSVLCIAELADRCEVATGPDRGLDLLIEMAVNGIPDVCGARLEEEDQQPAYTASLDAAMSLVPEADWPWNVTMATAYGSVSVMPCDGKSTGFHDKRAGHCRGAATPALSLCAAALRARMPTHPDRLNAQERV